MAERSSASHARGWGSISAKTTGGPAAAKSLQCSKTCQKAAEAAVTVSGEEEHRLSLGRSERIRRTW